MTTITKGSASPMEQPTDLNERLDRIESTQEIQRLAYRYAKAMDSRDLDALVACFVEDVQAGPELGRPGLKRFFDHQLRKYRASVHFVSNHMVELDGSDQARGTVYCRAEHEVGDQWIVEALQYEDEYARRDGRWLFRRRRPLMWYAVDWRDAPTGPDRSRWPGREERPAGLPDCWPSWGEFWASGPDLPVPG
jgi:SnoaL-like domain